MVSNWFIITLVGRPHSVRWEERREELGSRGGGALEETSREGSTGLKAEGELTRLDSWRTPPLKSFRALLYN